MDLAFSTTIFWMVYHIWALLCGCPCSPRHSWHMDRVLMSLTTIFSKALPWFHLVGTFFEAWSCFIVYLMGLFLYFMDLVDYFDDLEACTQIYASILLVDSSFHGSSSWHLIWGLLHLGGRVCGVVDVEVLAIGLKLARYCQFVLFYLCLERSAPSFEIPLDIFWSFYLEDTPRSIPMTPLMIWHGQLPC